MVLGRERVHHRARPQGLRRRPGVAAAGARRPGRPRIPLVAGLPAGQLPADQPPRRPGRVRQHGQHLPRRRREDLRRRGRQPHGRRRLHRQRQRRFDLLALRLPGRALRDRRLPPLRPQRQRRHRQLGRPVGDPELRAGRPVRPQDRVDVRPRQAHRLPQRPGLARRRRLPGRRRQAPAGRRPGRDRRPGGRRPVRLLRGHRGRQRRARRPRSTPASATSPSSATATWSATRSATGTCPG